MPKTQEEGTRRGEGGRRDGIDVCQLCYFGGRIHGRGGRRRGLPLHPPFARSVVVRSFARRIDGCVNRSPFCWFRSLPLPAILTIPLACRKIVECLPPPRCREISQSSFDGAESAKMIVKVFKSYNTLQSAQELIRCFAFMECEQNHGSKVHNLPA